MSKQPSAETQLRRVKAELREVTASYRDASERLKRTYAMCDALKAEREAWAERFDILLRRSDVKVDA